MLLIPVIPFRLRLPAAAICLALAAIPAAAQDASARTYDLPAQPLNATVARIAGDSGARISVDAELARGVTAAPVRGSLTAEAAMQQALAGSGLELVRTGSGVLTVRRAAAPAPAPLQGGRGEAALAEVRVAAQTERDGTTEGSGSYKAQYANTATKLSLSPRETPQTVSVVTRQQMDDFGMASVVDALGAVSGITAVDRGDWVSNYYSRGFLLQSQYDGIPNPNNTGAAYSAGPQIDAAFLDRVEVLQGASGLTSGAGYPGGTINLVHKRPTAEFQANAELQLGSWSHRRAVGDISGPLVDSGRIRGRLVAVTDDKDSFTDYVHSRRRGLYGVLEADLSPSTRLTASIRYQENSGRQNSAGIPVASDGSDLGLPRSTYIGSPRADFPEDDRIYKMGIEQKLGNDWKLTAAYSHNQVTANATEWTWFSGNVNRATGEGATLYYDEYYRSKRRINAFDAFVSGPFHLLGRKHEAALGLNGSAYISTYNATYFASENVNAYTFNPGNLPAATGLDVFSGQDKTRQWGVYGAAKFSLTDSLKLITGMRISNYESHSGDTVTAKESGKISPYAGALYDIDQQYTAYVSYSDIFSPQTYKSANGSFVKPVTGANYEMGVKGELLDKKLNVSGALFHLEQKNMAVVDTSVAYDTANVCNGYCYKAADRITSKRVEFSANGQITSDLNLMAGYTYVHSKYTSPKDSSYASYLPKHALRLAANYRIPGTALSVGGTARFQSHVDYAGTGYNIHQGGLAIFGLIAQYRITPRAEVNLAINNLFDKRYYSSLGQGLTYHFYGAPINGAVSLRYRF